MLGSCSFGGCGCGSSAFPPPPAINPFFLYETVFFLSFLLFFLKKEQQQKRDSKGERRCSKRKQNPDPKSHRKKQGSRNSTELNSTMWAGPRNEWINSLPPSLSLLLRLQLQLPIKHIIRRGKQRKRESKIVEKIIRGKEKYLLNSGYSFIYLLKARI